VLKWALTINPDARPNLASVFWLFRQLGLVCGRPYNVVRLSQFKIYGVWRVLHDLNFGRFGLSCCSAGPVGKRGWRMFNRTYVEIVRPVTILVLILWVYYMPVTVSGIILSVF
jgi:ABC-type amino acid transport system permease subunit